jgi:hypothetical protein
MGFELAPDPGDRGASEVRSGRLGRAALGEDRRLVRTGVQVLARGALVCPECALPVAPPPRIPPRTKLTCAFCDHHAEAASFLAEDVIDAPANDVVLVARVI